METKYIIGGLIAVLIVFGGIVWLLNSGGTPGNEAPNELNQTSPPPAPSGIIKEPMKAAISTDKGDIVLELYPDAAPKTVDNFVSKAQAGYFNGLKFHRVEDWVIQGGDPLSRDESKKQLWGTGGGDIATELSAKPFVVGALGVARGPNIEVSNDSQFFIVKTDAQFLNNQYTLFGQVTSGMDVVSKIQIGDIIQKISVE